MLVLTRKTGQKVIINNDIEVTILETRGDTVKIGINAPRNVTIFREELFEEIRRTNEQSVPRGQAESLGADLDQALQYLEPGAGQPPGQG